jgi:hypothetical protein
LYHSHSEHIQIFLFNKKFFKLLRIF